MGEEKGMNINMANGELDRIYNWSIRHEGCYQYQKIDSNSCFVAHENADYIREYGFETIAEIKKELEGMWLGEEYMEEIIKPVAVATMKHQPQNVEIKNKRESLDEFIYMF